VKRFKIDEGVSLNKKVDFIGDQSGNYLLTFSLDYRPRLNVSFDNKQNKKDYEDEILNIGEFIGIKGDKAKGKRLSNHIIGKAEFIEPLPYTEEEAEIPDQEMMVAGDEDIEGLTTRDDEEEDAADVIREEQEDKVEDHQAPEPADDEGSRIPGELKEDTATGKGSSRSKGKNETKKIGKKGKDDEDPSALQMELNF
jgi:hypothetical protein